MQEYFRRMVDAGLKYVVMEVSSQALKLERVGGFTFDYGIFTNLEEDHIGPAEHPDMADYIRCKGLLFRRCKQGLANADADYLHRGHGRPHLRSWRPSVMRDNADLCARGTSTASSGPATWASSTTWTALEHYHRPGGHSRRLHRLQLPGRHCPLPPSGRRPAGRFWPPWTPSRSRAVWRSCPTPGDYTLMIDYAHNAMAS